MYNRDTSNNRRKDTKTKQLQVKQNGQIINERRRNSEEEHN